MFFLLTFVPEYALIGFELPEHLVLTLVMAFFNPPTSVASVCISPSPF